MWSGACGLAAAARSIGLPACSPTVGAAFEVELNVHGAPDHGARYGGWRFGSCHSQSG
jgi:hypothetical protein